MHALSAVFSVSVVVTEESWGRHHHFWRFPVPGELTAHLEFQCKDFNPDRELGSCLLYIQGHWPPLGQDRAPTCLPEAYCPPGMASLLCTQQFLFLSHQRVPAFKV